MRLGQCVLLTNKDRQDNYQELHFGRLLDERYESSMRSGSHMTTEHVINCAPAHVTWYEHAVYIILRALRPFDNALQLACFRHHSPEPRGCGRSCACMPAVSFVLNTVLFLFYLCTALHMQQTAKQEKHVLHSERGGGTVIAVTM